MRRGYPLPALSSTLLLAASPLHAEEAPTPVDEVIVTATRLPAPASLTPGARVIDAEAIEARGAVFAADILADVPGLSLYRAGPFGGVASVRMRGVAQDKTLVLIDGVPQNDPSQPAGGFDFGALDLGDVERIEILSGPQGSLWGSDAIGGVIAFTTREPDGLRAEMEVGSYDTARGAVSGGVSRPGWALGGFASEIASNGLSRADAADGNTERDGFSGRTLGLSGRISPSDWLTVEARLRTNTAVADLDGYAPVPPYAFGDTDEVSDTTARTGFVRARIAGPAGFEHALTLAASDIDRAITGGAFPSRYTGERRLLRWQADGERMDGRLGLAVGLEREDIAGDLSTGTAAELGASSAFGVLRLDATPRLSTTFSVRLDDPDEYEAETTLRASAAYDLGGGWRLSGAWGQGFKTPTISQTLCDFCYSSAPFPVLTPERAEGLDLGVAWRSADHRLQAQATLYRLEVEDQIVFSFDPATFESAYENLERTRSVGLELDLRAELAAGFDLSAGYGWTDAENAVTGRRLLRTPEHAGSVTLGWRGGPARASVTVRHEGEQLDSPGLIEAYTVINAAGAYALTEQVALTLRVENLGDVRYQQLFGYGEPGRSAWVGVRLRY